MHVSSGFCQLLVYSLSVKAQHILYVYQGNWCIHCCHLHIIIGILKCVKAAILRVILHIL